MKKLLTLFLTITFLFPSFAQAALTDSLVSYYTMDEESGTRSDSTASNNDLTDNNTVLFGTGKISNAGDFETANTEYLSITDAAQTGLDFSTAMSISLWVNYESIVDSFFAHKFATVNQRSYAFGSVTTPDPDEVNVYLSADGSVPAPAVFAWVPSTATWYHLVFLYDGSAGSIELYVDNVSQGTVTGQAASLFNGTSPFYLGYQSTIGFDGLIDEYGLWSRVLTPTEISQLYNGGAALAYPLVPATPLVSAIKQDIIFFE